MPKRKSNKVTKKEKRKVEKTRNKKGSKKMASNFLHSSCMYNCILSLYHDSLLYTINQQFTFFFFLLKKFHKGSPVMDKYRYHIVANQQRHFNHFSKFCHLSQPFLHCTYCQIFPSLCIK